MLKKNIFFPVDSPIFLTEHAMLFLNILSHTLGVDLFVLSNLECKINIVVMVLQLVCLPTNKSTNVGVDWLVIFRTREALPQDQDTYYVPDKATHV